MHGAQEQPPSPPGAVEEVVAQQSRLSTHEAMSPQPCSSSCSVVTRVHTGAHAPGVSPGIGLQCLHGVALQMLHACMCLPSPCTAVRMADPAPGHIQVPVM